MPGSSDSVAACGVVFTSNVPLAVADMADPFWVCANREEIFANTEDAAMQAQAAKATARCLRFMPRNPGRVGRARAGDSPECLAPLWTVRLSNTAFVIRR